MRKIDSNWERLIQIEKDWPHRSPHCTSPSLLVPNHGEAREDSANYCFSKVLNEDVFFSQVLTEDVFFSQVSTQDIFTSVAVEVQLLWSKF